MTAILLKILQDKLYFSIIFLMCIPADFTNDFYSKFHQRDYKLDFQRLELVYYNKSVLYFLEIKTFKYNRTRPVANMTGSSKLNMSTGLEVAVQFYKFLSNEYRILPGSNFEVNYCKSINANIAGLQILFKCGNVTSCEIVQGTTYHVCNAYPDESRFPSFLPNGEYKFVLDFLHNGKIVVTTALYVKIYRPVAIPRKQH